MQWNDSTKFRGVYIKGDHMFNSIVMLPWRDTVFDVITDLKAIKAGHLTFIRNERDYSCLPHKAKDRQVTDAA